LSLFFAGCATKEEPMLPNTKAFALEDDLIIQALIATDIHDMDAATLLYYELYEKSGKKEYLLESVKSALSAKNIDKENFIKNAVAAYPEDRVFLRMLMMNYLAKKEFEKAEETLLPLLANEPENLDYDIAVSVYFALKKYDLALKYLQKKYAITNSEVDLEKIFYVLFETLGRKNEAISHLQSHIALHGGSEKLYYRLIGAYGNIQDVDGIISTYKKLYENNKNQEVAQKILELYMYKKDRLSAIAFLEQSGHNYGALIDLYASQDNYAKIIDLTQRLYDESGDIKMLGYNTIYYYELNKHNLTKKVLDVIIDKFENLTSRSDDAMYLNYYGYLLIDHNIDYKKGVTLVKKALQSEPESLSYLDSLAWGYYKMGKCKEALKLLEELKKRTTEQEILEHYEAVKKCKEIQ
jgi:predicted Zn-dependent protease